MKSTLIVGSALLQASTANFDVMAVIDASYAKLMENGYYASEVLHTSILNQPQECIDGKVTLEGEDFNCSNVDFLSFLGMADLEISYPAHREDLGARANDIWGWVGPSGREFTLLGLDNGATVIDSTDPANPCIIAKMPTRRAVDKWGDIKVHDNTMYHVKDTSYFRADGLDSEPEETANYGLEVYDLLPLDQLDCTVEDYVPLHVWPNYVMNDHGRSHNVVVNTESGLLYSVGTEKCAGGFMVLDVFTDRLKPTQVACVNEDNYTHDGQCLTYDGPDEDYQGREICLGFNEDTLTVWDFTDLDNYKLVSRTFYPNQAFTHQGWVTNDLKRVLMDDELDEICNNGNPTNSRRCEATSTYLTGLKTTSTIVFNIEDLDNPFFEGYFDHEDLSVDHNLYVWGTVHRKGWGGNPPMENYPDPNYAYMNNYLAGLKIVDIHSEDYTDWFTAGSFDISPQITQVEFAGAWSGYMHPSGVYAISSIERGLFLLKPSMAFTEEFPEAQSPASDSSDDGSGFSGAGIFLALALVAILATLSYFEYDRQKKLSTRPGAEAEPQGTVKSYIEP